jgi:hypothetical protein
MFLQIVKFLTAPLSSSVNVSSKCPTPTEFTSAICAGMYTDI